jgi:hypothetical protein
MYPLAVVLGFSLASGQGFPQEPHPILVKVLETAETARIDQFLPTTAGLAYLKGYAVGFLDGRSTRFLLS